MILLHIIALCKPLSPPKNGELYYIPDNGPPKIAVFLCDGSSQSYYRTCINGKWIPSSSLPTCQRRV